MMQVTYATGFTAEEYAQYGIQGLVMPRACCPNCHKVVAQHRHGCYERDVVSRLGTLVRIAVARFLCTGCGVTTSYLPEFALTYVLVGAATLEAHLMGEPGVDVERYRDLLCRYARRMEGFGPRLIQVVGLGLGLSPPAPGQRSARALADWLKKACGELNLAAGRLMEGFEIGILGRYKCHLGRRGYPQAWAGRWPVQSEGA